MIKLGGVEIDQRHQMQEFGVFGVCFELPSTAELGFEKPSALEFAKHLGIYSSGAAVHANIQVAFALPGGRSALATIHLRVGFASISRLIGDSWNARRKNRGSMLARSIIPRMLAALRRPKWGMALIAFLAEVAFDMSQVSAVGKTAQDF
jgi:hypothetical protein